MSRVSRDEILSRIQAVKPRYVGADFPDVGNELYHPLQPDSLSCFRTELEQVGGTCLLFDTDADMYKGLFAYLNDNELNPVYCRDAHIASELSKYAISFTKLDSDFVTMKAAVTACEFLVARTGSVVVSSASASGRQLHAFPPVHCVLAHSSQLVGFLSDAYEGMLRKYSDQLPSVITTITGPSRTADIEKTLVMGAHGPKKLVVFLSLQ